MSSGIDLNVSESNNTSKINNQQQSIIDEIQNNSIDSSSNITPQPKLVNFASLETELTPSNVGEESISNQSSTGSERDPNKRPTDSAFSTISQKNIAEKISVITSDLTKIAIQHLDKYQWQLPLMEMDKKFRDRTYYKHYTDTYISSLRSKLGHFLTDNQLISNPMRYHLKQELDNHEKYSRMFELLTDYYQSIGGGFFSFATPSPDEEIVIGCRLGTKGYYPSRFSWPMDRYMQLFHLLLLCCFCCCSSDPR